MQAAFDRLLLRVARRIHANLARPHEQPMLQLPRPEWQGCCDLSRKIIRAESAGLGLAAGRLRTQLYGMLKQLRRRVCDQWDEFQVCDVRFPSVQEIFDDLRGLRNEFADVEIDVPNRVLSVATEPITLEQVELGAFWIQLPWDDCTEYRVQALDPDPNLCDDDHPHPHISGDQLCEGDGHSAIHRALKDGRLFDFFVLVRQVLRNYHPESAYVRLEEWGYQPCAGCGVLVDTERMNYCSDCDSLFCSNCVSGCPGCDGYVCHSCRGGCEYCAKKTTHCACCIGQCDGCSRLICDDCRQEGLCAECRMEPSGRESRCAVCQRDLLPEETLRCERCCVPLCGNCPESCPKHAGAFCCRCILTCNSCQSERCRDHLNNCLQCKELCCHDCTENRICARCRGNSTAAPKGGPETHAPGAAPSPPQADPAEA